MCSPFPSFGMACMDAIVPDVPILLFLWVRWPVRISSGYIDVIAGISAIWAI